MSCSDSVSTEIQRIYEETVRNSLASILRNAFGTCCRQPMGGFQRLFNKRDSMENLWWSNKPADSHLQIDFLAHVTPLSTLSEIDIQKVSENPHVVVKKSTNKSTSINQTGTQSVALDLKQTMINSPEKTDALSDDGDGDNQHFQNVVAEITCGGLKSVKSKLEQLEKDCFFLCSRACPSLTSEANFQVLETVAFVAVVSPTVETKPPAKYLCVRFDPYVSTF